MKTTTIRPSAEPNDIEIARYELFVDGLRDGNCAPGETMEVDANNLAEGYHELGVVAVAKEQPQTQGRAVLPFHVPRGEPKLTVTRPDLGAQSPLIISGGGGIMTLMRSGGTQVILNSASLQVTNVSFVVTPAAFGRPTEVDVSFLVNAMPFVFKTYLRQ